MPPIDGVQFDEEKMNLGPLPSRVMPVTVSDKLSFTQWLMKHGVRSKEAAEAILIGIVILNVIIMVFVIFTFIL